MPHRRHAPTGQAAPERSRTGPTARGDAAPRPPRRPLRETLLRTLPGRLLVVSIAVKIVAAAVQLAAPVPTPLRVLNGVASVGLVVALGYFSWRALLGVKRRLLWRVRRKLILSYVFIGFVPTLLILAFFLFGARLMSMNVSAYLFRDGYDNVLAELQSVARETRAAIEVRGADPEQVLVRRITEARTRYADLSLALVPVAAVDLPAGPTAATVDPSASASPPRPGHRAGPWWHLDPPDTMPGWLPSDGFAGTMAAAPADAPGDVVLVMRVVSLPSNRSSGYAVVADLPVGGQVIEHLYDATGIRVGNVSVSADRAGSAGEAEAVPGLAVSSPANPVSPFNFQYSVAFLDCVNWSDGRAGSASISLNVRFGLLYERISSVQAALAGGYTLGDVFQIVLVAVAGLFLIIEAVALVMGFTLARSITSSVHELFMGTERVRGGDFTHRIHVKTRDQLGELSESFNQMTSSIEDLLQEAAEKKRLEEELRIAREIQMSLLPDGPLQLPGLSVAALCVPAREVGGDYYDFFRLGDRRVGVLIADVAGKGTSAALYMAELKGLMLSLSQVWSSPRQLLIHANRILADNLDSRAFITMTYAVIDLDARRLTYARAGHTPLIYVPARARAAQILTPNGMVVGLRLPGAEEKFGELLEEHTLPLETGDVIVLYTDGISEAMNPQADLFGDARLSRLVEEHRHLDATELRERILREVQAFASGADQHDDMTMVLLKVEDRLPVASGVGVSEAASTGGPA